MPRKARSRRFDHPTLAEIHRREPTWPIQMIYAAGLTDPVGAARACGANFVYLETGILPGGGCGAPA